MTRQKNLLTKLKTLIKPIRSKENHVLLELEKDLYSEAWTEAFQELENEKQISNMLMEIEIKINNGQDLTDKEALELGLIRI